MRAKTNPGVGRRGEPLKRSPHSTNLLLTMLMLNPTKILPFNPLTHAYAIDSTIFVIYNNGNMTTSRLYIKPSFLRGMGSIGNLSGSLLYKKYQTPQEADTEAIKSDWEMVGSDLKWAIEEYGKENKSS